MVIFKASSHSFTDEAAGIGLQKSNENFGGQSSGWVWGGGRWVGEEGDGYGEEGDGYGEEGDKCEKNV